MLPLLPISKNPIMRHAYIIDIWKPVLQAISVIHADNMIRVAIRRALGYRHGYPHKTWIFRFWRCSAAANNAIRVGHCATGAIHNINDCANIVMELSRFPRAWRRKRDDPKGELPLCQAIFTASSITYPAHTGHILCLVYSRMQPPLKDARNETDFGSVATVSLNKQ